MGEYAKITCSGCLHEIDDVWVEELTQKISLVVSTEDCTCQQHLIDGAVNDAFDDGFKEGKEEGKEEGEKVGYDRGYEAGYTKGWDDGYDRGLKATESER